MMKSVLSTAGLIAAAAAFTQPTSQTYGALLTPDLNTPVTTGQTYDITWSPKQPADGVTVSLVLCNGPGSNCVLQGSAIAEGIPASAAKYSWSVPCSLPEGTQNTDSGYGMLIIVDGTGEFQYSTQFSVKKGDSCSSSSTTTTTASSSSSSSSSSSGPGPVHTDSASTWMAWNSTMTSTTSSVPSASKSYTFATSTTAQAVTTSSATYTYVKPTTSSAASATSAAQTSAFTGAAALPTAFLNVAGLVGGLAMLAL